MKAFVVLLLWILLGFGYYSAQKSYCSSGPFAAQLPQTKIAATNPSEGNAKIPVSNVESSVDTIKTPPAKAENSTTPAKYNHDTYTTFRKEGKKTIIDASGEEDLMNDEMQALLEASCNRLQNNFCKVSITSYGVSKIGVLRKMEDFLIRCGLSPQRVKLRQRNSNDTYDNKLVFQIID